MNTCSASAYTLKGSPFQITTSPILPASSVPVTLSMPSALGGFNVSHVWRARAKSQAGAHAASHRLGRFLVEALNAFGGIGMHDCAAIARHVGEREIFLHAIEGFHLEAPPVGPLGAANAVLRQQVGDLVSFDGVMERGDLEAEFLRQVDHDRHLIGAVAVDVHQDLALHCAHQRLGFQVALGR